MHSFAEVMHNSANGGLCDWTGLLLLRLLLVLLLVLVCSDSWETCLFPAISIAIAARQRNLYYTFFFSVRNTMCGVRMGQIA